MTLTIETNDIGYICYINNDKDLDVFRDKLDKKGYIFSVEKNHE